MTDKPLPRVRRPYFSKSKLIKGWQCQKMLYLDRHHRNLAVVPEDRQAIFDVGNIVGKMAQEKYGTDDSVEIPYNYDTKVMLAETAKLLASGVDYPIFEATFQHQGVLIRADVMIPDGDAWHVIEVKSGTSAKDVNKFDAAIQLWVLRGAGLSIKSISLAYIDNEFEYQGAFTGVLVLGVVKLPAGMGHAADQSHCFILSGELDISVVGVAL